MKLTHETSNNHYWLTIPKLRVQYRRMLEKIRPPKFLDLSGQWCHTPDCLGCPHRHLENKPRQSSDHAGIILSDSIISPPARFCNSENENLVSNAQNIPPLVHNQLKRRKPYLGELNLHRVIREYVTYFNHALPHQGIVQQIPGWRPSVPEKQGKAKIIAFPVLNELQQGYRMAA